MFSGNFLGASLRVLAAGTLVALLSACAGTVKLPDEPRKFKVGEEVPERFEFFRSDEEIRGRLLSGTWKSREVKSVSYTETSSNSSVVRRSRKNSPLTKTTYAFVFFEDGNFTESVAATYPDGRKTTKALFGQWSVKNGGLRLLIQSEDNPVPVREVYSLHFLDGATFEMLRDDFAEAMETDAAQMKEVAAKNGFSYFQTQGKMFRDANGNLYRVDKSDSELYRIRTKTRVTSKFSPFILERQ